MHETDPSTTTPPWQQVSLRFDSWDAAEPTAVADLGPLLADAETAGLISSWFFTRKSPCWRVRFLPTDHNHPLPATAFVHEGLNDLHQAGRIAGWVEGIYEPETHAFGGPAAMTIAHRLWHQDSHHILTHLATGGRDQRREVTILLCAALLRAAGQDWYEQGDIWARVSQHRSPPPELPADRLRDKQNDLRRLLTVDTEKLFSHNHSLGFAADWAAAFTSAGTELADLARHGNLERGLRAVLAHHVIFAWNRIGLPHTTQSVLAHLATAVVFDQ